MDIEKINVGGTQYNVCDTVARAAVSDEFSTGAAYAAGDYCIYENTLFKFTAAKDPGAWDASKVAATQISDELSQLNGKTGKLKILNGDGVDVYYSESITILYIHITIASCSNNKTLDGVALPDGVLPTGDRAIVLPVLSTNWYPTNQIVYLNFGAAKSQPVLRVASDQSSISNIVLMGYFAFPTGFFTLPADDQSL